MADRPYRMAYAQDWRAWDRQDAPAVTVVGPAGPARKDATSFGVPAALRGNVRRREKSPSGGVYLGFEASWAVPMALTPEGEAVRVGDTLVEPDASRASGEARHTVLTVHADYSGAVYHVGTVDLALALHLADSVEIHRATLAADDAGAVVKRWPPGGGVVLKRCLARVQPLEEQAAQERGVRYGKRRYDVTVDWDAVGIDVAEDTVWWQDLTGAGGPAYKRLDVVRLVRPQQLDALPALECVWNR